MESVTVGLDIGSSAIRAAEIQVTKEGRKTLRRYAQVGLPSGYVVDGDIINVPGVAAALKRLWIEAGFSSKNVVVGVSGPRVFVRQADVPALAEEDLRSSLKFDAQELVPINMDDATFDFSILGEPTTDSDGKATVRILLVAAHRELLRNYTVTLREAGLTAKVIDAGPLSLIRAVPHVSEDRPGNVEVIVSIGAELTTIAVREAGVPRFLRTLTLGGNKLTERLSNTMHVEMSVAERLKRAPGERDDPVYAQVRRAMTPEMRDLSEEIRATIEFFLSQSGGAEVERLLVTGGAAQTEGLAAAIASDLPCPVMRIDPLAQLDTSPLAFDDQTMARIGASGANAVGLALWPTEAPFIRLSLLPEEVAAARRARRLFTMAATGVCAFAGVLAVAGAVEVLSASSAEHHAKVAEKQAASLQAQVDVLHTKTAVHNQVLARQQVVTGALQGDVDWVRFIGQLASVMPSNLSLTSFNASRTTASSPAGGGGVGSVTFSVKGTGGLPAAAAWISGLQSDPDVANVVLGGISVKQNGGDVVFSSNATLTPVSYSNRDRSVGK